MRNRESAFRKGLRKLFRALGDADATFYPSTAAPAPPLHVEHGPAQPVRQPASRPLRPRTPQPARQRSVPRRGRGRR